MLRFFQRVLPSLGSVSNISVRSVAQQAVNNSFEQYCIGQNSINNFREARKSFLRAQEYLEKNDLVNAKKAIEEAIQIGRRVSALFPKSFLLHFQRLEHDIDLSVTHQGNKLKIK